MSERLKEFRDELIGTIEEMDGVASASPIEGTSDLAIGVELEGGELFFVQVQPA